MRRWLFRALMLLVVLGLLALIVRAYLPKPLAVDTAQVTQGPFAATVEYTGKTRVKNRYTLSSPAQGTLSRIVLKAGDAVTPDSLVAWLRPMRPALLDARTFAETQLKIKALQDARRETQNREQSALTALREAQMEVARVQKLFEGRAATQQELERLQFQLQRAQRDVASTQFASEVARHELESAQALLRPQTQAGAEQTFPLHAPIRGVVLRILQNNEGPVMAGTPLIELGDLNSLEAVVEVQTRDAVRLQAGMKTRLEEWGGDLPLEGHIRQVEPSAFTDVSPLGVEEQRVNVVVDFVVPEPTLGDGFEFLAQFILWEGAEVLQVPTSAVFRKNQEYGVFVAAHGKAEERTLRLGHRNPKAIEVLEGVALGETIILHPSENLFPGTRIEPR